MNTRSIEVVGTFQGCWTHWVNQVLVGSGHANVHTDPQSLQTLNAVVLGRPESHVLMLFEHPATGLSHVLGINDDVDPEAWLDDWQATARAIVAYAQRHPDTTLVVNAEEVRRRPRRLAQLLDARWGDQFAVPSRIVGHDYNPDPLVNALAWGLIARDYALQEVLPDLMASCVVLPGYRSSSAQPMPGGFVEAADAACRLAELMQAERDLARAESDKVTEQSALRCELQIASDKCAQLTAAMQTVESDRDRLMALRSASDRALDEARLKPEAEVRERNTLATRIDDAENRQLSDTNELPAAREKLVALCQQIDDDRAPLAQSEKTRSTIDQGLTQGTKPRSTVEQELIQIERRRNTLDQELAEAKKERNELEQELVLVKRRGCALEQELAKAKESARAAIEEGDLVLQQLHRVQERFEHASLSKGSTEGEAVAAAAGSHLGKLEQDLRNAREECELLTLQDLQVRMELNRLHAERMQLTDKANSGVAPLAINDVSIDEVVVLGERDTPPHREVSFIVQKVRVGERYVAEAAVRLVEHWGRPGLVVFADDEHAPLFETWREGGREDGRPYMLLVHGEESAQSAYEAMGALDWQVIQTLVARLGQVLQDRAGSMQSTWCALAQRLLASLHEQPARLRYEKIVGTQVEQGVQGNPRFRLTIERASYQGRHWRRLPIQWQPTGPNPSLDLENDEVNGPPLLAWPAGADGVPVGTLRLPLGDDPNTPDVRAAWDILSGSDRAIVEELLSLMPILAARLEEIPVSEGNGPRLIDLRAAATDTMLFGRIALRPRGTAPHQDRSRGPLLHRMARQLRIMAEPTSVKSPAAEPAFDR